MNGSPKTIAELNGLPIKTQNGTTIYIRDVAHVRDGFSPQTNIVRQDGTSRHAAYGDEKRRRFHDRHCQQHQGNAAAQWRHAARRIST